MGVSIRFLISWGLQLDFTILVIPPRYVHHSNCSRFVLFQTGHVSIFHNFLNLLVGVFLHVFAVLAALGGPEYILVCSGEGREPPWSLLPFGIRIPL
jgi:hypothetical protein